MFQTAAQEDPRSAAELEDEVFELERQLIAAREKLKTRRGDDDLNEAGAPPSLPLRPRRRQRRRDQQQHRQTGRSADDSFAEHHHLLLLSDSALPLGSFAFSSGLESYREHARAAAAAAVTTTANSSTSHRGQQHVGNTASSASRARAPPSPSWSFADFLPLSLSSYASTTLPFVLAAHRDPRALAELDDALDAATICTVGRRASCAQGRALLGIWEKSLVGELGLVEGRDGGGYSEDETGYDGSGEEEGEEWEEEDIDIPGIIKAFTALLRRSNTTTTTTTTTTSTATTLPSSSIPAVSAHLAPLFGTVSRALGLDAHQTAYIFMLSHVKALVSAAIRGGMFGPFQAQKILAGRDVRLLLPALIAREWDVPVEKAGQSAPVVDLWIGRHEILYSRVFNS